MMGVVRNAGKRGWRAGERSERRANKPEAKG